MNWNRLTMTVADNEGFRPRPYYCSEGVLTIGYGWALERNDLPRSIAMDMLKWKLEKCAKQASLLVVNWVDLEDLRKEVLTEMVYQLGYRGVSKFRRMLNAIDQGQFKIAAIEMLDSRWATQTPARAKGLAMKMRNNQ